MSVSDPGEKIEWGADSQPRKNERMPSSVYTTVQGASSSHVPNLLFICILNETAGGWGEGGRGGGREGSGGGVSVQIHKTAIFHIF
jgi:hypothetical protein